MAASGHVEAEPARDPFQVAFERAPMPMALLSPGGDVVRANVRFARMLGVPDERHLIARSLRDLLADDVSLPERLVADDVGQAEWNVRLRRAGGDAVEARVTIWATHDGERELLAVMLDEVAPVLLPSDRPAADATVEWMLESISDAFVALDDAWRFTYVSERAAQLMRRDRVALLGRSIWRVFPEVLGTRFHAEAARAMRDREPVQFEEPYAPLGIWVGVSVYPTSGGVSIFMRDVSERKRVEQALLESERRFRSLVASSSQLVWAADARGRVEDIPSWRALTGQTAGEVRGWGWIDAIHPADRERTRQIFAEGIANGTRCETLYRVRTRAGEYRYVFHRAIAVKDDRGDVCEWVGTCADINERKRADEWRAFLADASRMLGSSLDVETTISSIARLAVSSLADYAIVYMIDDAGSVTVCDAVHRDPVRADRLREMVTRYPPDVSRDNQPVVRAMRTGQSIHVPAVSDEMLRNIAHGEEHLRMLRELAPISGLNIPLIARGRTIGALALRRAVPGWTFSDTDLVYAEELASRAAQALDNALLYQQARQARQEAELARTDAERLRLEAEGANHAKSEFLAVMSHELRTPLNAIAGYADLLDMGIRGELNDAQREDLRRIKRSGAHLLGLINEILNFARIEAGRVQLDIRNVRVDEALAAAETLVAPQARAKGLTLIRGRCHPALCAHADRERVQQVVLNLLTNALKFTESGGRMTISATREGERVAIRVGDTGRGIPAEKLEAIFEPFVQVDGRLAREQEGVGLGLAISRELARAMGGNLTVESTIGVGSTFTLWLPVSGSTVAGAD